MHLNCEHFFETMKKRDEKKTKGTLKLKRQNQIDKPWRNKKRDN